MQDTPFHQPEPEQAAIYEITVEGHLDDAWSDWFEGLTVTSEEDGTTLLSGPVTDQAALHGLLRRVRDLGTPLLSVGSNHRRGGTAVSHRITSHLAAGRLARITGAFYLAFILTSVLADRLGHIGLGSARQIYESVVADPSSFRLALVVGLISAFLFLVSAWGLYVLLRPVNKDLALLFLLLNTVGVAIQCASMFPLLSALLMGDAGSHLQAYSAGQLEGLGLLYAGVYRVGFVTAQLFFGTWLFPLGYLVYKSGYLPRFLGVLLMADGVAVLVWFFQAIVLPDHPAITSPGIVVSFVAEVGLTAWLLIKGVKVVDTTKEYPWRP